MPQALLVSRVAATQITQFWAVARYYAGFTPELATAQEDDAVRGSLDLAAAALGKLERAEQGWSRSSRSRPTGPLPCFEAAGLTVAGSLVDRERRLGAAGGGHHRELWVTLASDGMHSWALYASLGG